MTAYTYAEKLAESLDPVVQQALHKLYASLWPERTVVSVKAISDTVFQRQGRDIKVTLRGTRGNQLEIAICETIEEKIRSHGEASSFGDLLIETLSNEQLGTAGWIYTSSAEWLSYVRQFSGGRLLVWIIPMRELRMWFTTQPVDRFKSVNSWTPVGNGGGYRTVNRAVPLNDRPFKAFWETHFCREFRINAF